ncbi:MAG: hypothetical protein L3J38_04025 [Thiomicrorhabdus sp.]|nr:hypothetical protein [Thiomicrorhabdus sp.]
MSNIVDDLLQEVEQLEASTQAMDSDVQQLEQQQQKLNDSALTAQNTLLLEATKTSQEASKQSHLAASTAIKLAEQLKARNSELEDLSNNWRQAVRNTLREQQAAKKYFAIMMGTTLAVSIISLSSIGYLVYLLNQQNAHHKGEVLDIIQTESKLLSNKIIVKTDELASLTEAMATDIKRLSGLANEPLSSIKPTVKQPTKVKDSPVQGLNIEQLNAQHAELKTLIQQLINKQQTVKNTPIINKQTANPVQLKQLKDLSWLIRKQDKALKSIQKSLSGKFASPSNNKHLQQTLEALKGELSTLNQQQTKIQQQLKTLQEGFSKHLKKPVDKPPYSYKSTTDYKLN